MLSLSSKLLFFFFSVLSLSLSLSFSSRLDLVQLGEPLQDHPLARLRHLPSGNKLVQNQIDSVEVEDEVELADVAEIVVEDLDEEVDCFQEGELVVRGVAGDGEVEARVAAVDDLEGRVLLIFFFFLKEKERGTRLRVFFISFVVVAVVVVVSLFSSRSLFIFSLTSTTFESFESRPAVSLCTSYSRARLEASSRGT